MFRLADEQSANTRAVAERDTNGRDPSFECADEFDTRQTREPFVRARIGGRMDGYAVAANTTIGFAQ